MQEALVYSMKVNVQPCHMLIAKQKNQGVNVETKQPVAIKLEPGNCRVQQLQDEYKIYRLLGGARKVFHQQGVCCSYDSCVLP